MPKSTTANSNNGQSRTLPFSASSREIKITNVVWGELIPPTLGNANDPNLATFLNDINNIHNNNQN